jgi:hypothetical protein
MRRRNPNMHGWPACLAELTTAMEPYLPIVRTFVVLGNVVPSLRERLIQRIEAGLRSED